MNPNRFLTHDHCRWAWLLVGLALLALIPQSYGGVPRHWDYAPYRVRVEIVARGTRLTDPDALSHLVKRLQERIDARLRPLWDATVISVPQDERPVPPKSLAADADKRIVLTATQSGPIIEMYAREYDATLRRWGGVQKTNAGNVEDVAEAAFGVVTQAFAPLAAFEIDPQDPSIVVLNFRGNKLSKSEVFARAPAGTVMLPFLRRVDRQGNPLAGGQQRVPWTYLVVAIQDPERSLTEADVYSHTRLPFGSRRRGRVEQLALAVDHDRDVPTRLRLHAQQDATIPLSGYEVFTSLPGSTVLTRIGRTDRTGSIQIPPSEDVLLVHIRCGSSVVASLPIAPGVEPLLNAPLLDERQRIEAETKLSVMREELLDLVARRQILSARIRRRIESEDLQTAERLLRELEALPGRAQFNQRLERAEQFYRADNPVVQRRLDRLFAETRSVLGSSLDARQTREVASEVLEARALLKTK